MNSRKLIIYEYQILYQILKEIEENLNFEIIQSNYKDFRDIKFNSNVTALTDFSVDTVTYQQIQDSQANEEIQ